MSRSSHVTAVVASAAVPEMCGMWLQFAERAVQSQPSKTDAEQRARQFKFKYTRRLRELKVNPWYYYCYPRQLYSCQRG